MGTIGKFEDLLVWQKARDLCREIFQIASAGSFSRDFKLKDQILASSGSIMDNIAEGFGRGGNGEFIHFLGIAAGSTAEVKSQLYRAIDRGHIDERKLRELILTVDDISNMLGSLIRYLKQSKLKGQKFKTDSK